MSLPPKNYEVKQISPIRLKSTFVGKESTFFSKRQFREIDLYDLTKHFRHLHKNDYRAITKISPLPFLTVVSKVEYGYIYLNIYN